MGRAPVDCAVLFAGAFSFSWPSHRHLTAASSRLLPSRLRPRSKERAADVLGDTDARGTEASRRRDARFRLQSHNH
jgi:hypothetical protein